jgi:hypothetical protein
VVDVLSVASASVLSTWARRTGFVVAVGVLLAITVDLSRCGIGGCPLGSAAAMAVVRVAGWTLAGLAMAWATRPRAKESGPAQEVALQPDLSVASDWWVGKKKRPLRGVRLAILSPVG